jgi:hypothetical protein
MGQGEGFPSSRYGVHPVKDLVGGCYLFGVDDLVSLDLEAKP